METPRESLAPFDREYTLSELLPPEMVLTWSRMVPHLGVSHLSVIMPDGTPLLPTVAPSDIKRAIHQWVVQVRPETKVCQPTPQGEAIIYPLLHELEPVGYLILEFRLDGEEEREKIDATGTLLNTAITEIMKRGYSLAMTTQLHGETVEDSFEILKKKAYQLARSEKKYRLLATSLNDEVIRKTKEIRQTQEQLMMQEKMASIGQLAAGVAHEINNPMGFITSNLNSLEEYTGELIELIIRLRALVHCRKEAQGPCAEEERQCLHDIQDFCGTTDIDFILKDIPPLIGESIDGAERIRKIVEDLKDFAHPGEEEPSYANINTNLDKSINIVGSELKYRVTLKREYGTLPEVRCYPRQLDQVFINLLVNGAHAITEKGTITVTTRHDPTHIIVAISDTGSGIPKESLKKIFDPFYTTKPVGKGTGLGLNMVYNIIKRHRGSIHVKSDLGKGTTFTLRIPLSPPGAKETP